MAAPTNSDLAMEALVLMTKNDELRAILEKFCPRGADPNDGAILAMAKLATALMPRIKDPAAFLSDLLQIQLRTLIPMIACIPWTPLRLSAAFKDVPPEEAENPRFLVAMQALRIATGRPSWEMHDTNVTGTIAVADSLNRQRTCREMKGFSLTYGLDAAMISGRSRFVVPPVHVRKMRIARARERRPGPYDRVCPHCDEMAGYRCIRCPRVRPDVISERAEEWYAGTDS